MNSFSLNIIFILIPGILSTIILNKLTVTKEVSQFRFLINSLLLGVLSYLILQLLVFCIILSPSEGLNYLDIWTAINTENKNNIPFWEVFFSSIIGVVIGFVAALIETNRYLHRFGNYMNFTRKYGGENLYTYLLDYENLNEVYVRDYEKNLTYHGFVKHFNEISETKELVLKNVSVYKDDNLLYEIEMIYLCLKSGTFRIEIPLFSKIDNE